jgi:hypothetical protein
MRNLITRKQRTKALCALCRQLELAINLLTDLDYKRAEYPEGTPDYVLATETMRCVQYRVNSISDNIGILEEMLGIARVE